MQCDHRSHAGALSYDEVPRATHIVRVWIGPENLELTQAYCADHDRLMVSDAILYRIPYARMVLPTEAEAQAQHDNGDWNDAWPNVCDRCGKPRQIDEA